nr:putative rna 3'-terminal phosphate cyclase [Quercus suber]
MRRLSIDLTRYDAQLVCIFVCSDVYRKIQDKDLAEVLEFSCTTAIIRPETQKRIHCIRMAGTHAQRPIRLDGRTLEGGGQLVRNALVLAALTGQSVEISNIRGNRSGGGGLKAQHLACVKWLQHATNAHLEGAERKSTALLFEPRHRGNGVSPVFKKVSCADGQGQIYEARVDVEKVPFSFTAAPRWSRNHYISTCFPFGSKSDVYRKIQDKDLAEVLEFSCTTAIIRPETQKRIHCIRMAGTHAQRPIRLDGRTLEGGGQLVRNALVLAALTGQSVEISNIRGNRSGGGGLKAQHLACVKWLQHATNAHLEGAERKSTALLFEPRHRGNGVSPVFKKVSCADGQGQIYEARVDVETAGSTGLVLQAVLPYVLCSSFESKIPIRLILSGGTNVSGSPSYEYISQVLLPMLHTIGFPPMTSTLEKRGWSQGGSSIGSFSITIPPRESFRLPAFQLLGPASVEPRRQISHLTATFLAPTHCHEHFKAIIPLLLHRYFPLAPDRISVICEDSRHDKRLYLIIVAELTPSAPAETPVVLARDELYCRKLSASGGHLRATTEMAEHVAAKLDVEVRSGACVDEHMRDQLVIFQALAEGRSEVFPGYRLSGEDEDALERVVEGPAAEDEDGTNPSKAEDRASLSFKDLRAAGDGSHLSHRAKQKEKATRHRNRRFMTDSALDGQDDPFEREVSAPTSAPPPPPPRDDALLALELAHETKRDLSSITAEAPSELPPWAEERLLRPASLHTRTAEWVVGRFLSRNGNGDEILGAAGYVAGLSRMLTRSRLEDS